MAAAESAQPGALGHEPSLMVAIEEYLLSNEFMQPRKTQAVGTRVLKLAS